MKQSISLFIILFIYQISAAQTSTSLRIASYEKEKDKPSLLHGIDFRNIGPSIMSGRITDIEVNPDNPNEFYVAYASGGVWHSTNNGQSMTPIFDNQASITVGDMCMDWRNHTLWVGTGEVNSSRSSYAGTGIYKTSDTGKTWQHMGLEESHHVGKILVHPKNKNTAWVAVLGHLYTSNTERGLYKTEDGGKTWKQTLFVNDTTGCIDLVQDIANPQIMYTATWTRTRKAWYFNGSGEGSAIYKSLDGGDTWIKITDGKNGFPQGSGVGRIGLAISQSNSKILYAVLDNNFNQEKKKDEEKSIKARDIAKMTEAEFLAIKDKELDTYLRQNGYPEKYNAKTVKESIQKKEYKVKAVADWKLADDNANLFDTPIYGAEVYRSNDAGASWKKTHELPLDGVHFTYGYYFACIAVSPKNADKLLVGGYPMILSVDGGKNFKRIDGDNCHPDYHRFWINPKDDNHILACNDGGLNITYDNGEHWYKANNPAVGQFYAIQVDDAKPYNVYGGLQDNGTWTAPSTTTENTGWHQSGQYAYKELGGGDGMQIQVDTRTNNTVYIGYQFGNYFRMDKNTNDYKSVTPTYDIGEKALRFNWQTPINLSKHNQDVFYLGSNKFHRSLQAGDAMLTLSEDLAPTTLKGNVPYGTLTSISESPLKFGLLYVGSDNGYIHVSKDLGYNWTKISNTLPQKLWVSRVIASKHKESRVYASLNGYRNDDFAPYLYLSNDYGKSWTSISDALPHEPINVIKEDPTNEDILYVGTDNGLYVSLNRGKDFMPWRASLPRVAIHDIAIQERENELVLGTHGRSLYIVKLDKVQKLKTIEKQALYVFDIDTIKHNKKWGTQATALSEAIEPELSIQYFSKEAQAINITLSNAKGKILHSIKQDASAGYNKASYDLSIAPIRSSSKMLKAENGKYYLAPGGYTITVSNAQGIKEVKGFYIKE